MVVLENIWERFLTLVRGEVGSQVVDSWLKSVSLAEINEKESKLLFYVPNQFVYSWIKNNYMYLFKEKFPQILGTQIFTFDFKVIAQTGTVSANEKEDESSAKYEATSLLYRSAKLQAKNSWQKNKNSENPKQKKDALNSKYLFENFVVGPHNYLAYSGAQAVAKGFAKRYNPLFIYGKTGLGKTHLLHCIGNEYKKNFSLNKIIYKNSITFIEEFIESVKGNKVQSFIDKYRKVDLLLIDDVQFLGQKEQTQEVFFNIFNRMYDEKKQIVLSSDVAPTNLHGFQERLISRLSWGLMADIGLPTLETKVAILLKKAEELSIELDQDTALYIAKNFTSNIREMEGALTKLSAMTMLTLNPISIDFAKKELVPTRLVETKQLIAPEAVLAAVLKNSGLSLDDLKSKKRHSEVVLARHMVVYLLKKYTKSSLRTIGSFVGGRTHSTVLYSVSKIKDQCLADPLFNSKMQNIESLLS